MEPASIVSLVGTCLSISTRVATIGQQLYTLKERYKHVERNITLFEMQLSALNTAARRVSIWLERPSTQCPTEMQIELKQSLEACDTLVLLIMEYLSQSQSRQAKMGLWSKTKHIWDENTIKEYEGMLRGQVQALSLLLQILALPATMDQEKQMVDSDTITILARARDSSSSLLWLRDAESTRTVTSIATDNMETLDKTFDFDELIVKSRVYRSTLASLLREKIERDKMKPNRLLGSSTDNIARLDRPSSTIVSHPKTVFRMETDLSWLRIGSANLDVDTAVDTPPAEGSMSEPTIPQVGWRDTPIVGPIEIKSPTISDAMEPIHEDSTVSQNGSTQANKDQQIESPLDDYDFNIDRISSPPSIDNEDIDSEVFFALHTRVATQEGQVAVIKGDALVLLDDSDSYWWLIRVVKDGNYGYLPAEHIESPTERLARLNKHRNVDIASPFLGETTNKATRARRQFRQRNKTVQFDSSLFIIGTAAEYYDSALEEDNSTAQLIKQWAQLPRRGNLELHPSTLIGLGGEGPRGYEAG